ncbi:MAG TPA: hypothetical protein VNG53_05130 [Bacteroidia bacterium]|nr:hypothetical protein [Bacteroidia bacterium]
MNFTKKLTIIFLIAFSNFSIGQQRIKGIDYSYFQLKNKKDTIDFVVADTAFNAVKPIFLFCQGSQPIPLFLEIKGRNPFPLSLSNFDINKIEKHYYVVEISMPKTPLIVGFNHLDKSYNYVRDTSQENSYLSDYLKSNYLDNYVQRANQVINYLRHQKWVNKQKLIVAGHSQGAQVAVCIAASNKKVTKLGLFGYDPHNRIGIEIRQARKDAENGKITWAEADSITSAQYEFYKEVQNKDSVQKYPSLIGDKSFSQSTLDKLINLNIPIYIAYGSNDIIADFCDLIPLYFIEKHKTNLTRIRYPNLGHNFFPIDKNGKRDYSRAQWKFVMNQFVTWTLK